MYILRRMDTGAISVTTMFRAAFPTASEEAAEAENNWINAGSGHARANKPHFLKFPSLGGTTNARRDIRSTSATH